MKPIELNLPKVSLGRIKIKGHLYDTKDPVYLVQDILDIELPNGISIDVGWHPESDITGAYRVVVYRGYWSNQLTEPCRTKGALEVVDIVQRLVKEFSAPTVTISASKETRHERSYKPSSFRSAIAITAA